MRFRDFLASILEQDLGCSCHEYVNQNGYGQCKKKDFHQEHVKLLHVCYVNQPSNCSDLYYIPQVISKHPDNHFAL